MEFDGQRYDIRAGVHSIGGYSAHADQAGLVGFVTGMEQWPGEIRLVHGDMPAKCALANAIRERYLSQALNGNIILSGIINEVATSHRI